MHAVYRLVVQLIAGLAIASIGVKVTNLDYLFTLGNLHISLLAVPFTAIAITGLCNAYNIVDGIDGLAGGLTLVSVGSLLFLILCKAPDNETALLAFLCISILTFMVFNLTLRSKIKVLWAMQASHSLAALLP